MELLNVFLTLFTAETLFWICVGTMLGIVVGAIPGLTATMAVSLLLSVTYGMDLSQALAVLISVYLGGIYGGSRSAILLNIPGTPSAAATCLDGYPLAQKGEGTLASVLVTMSSAIGGWIGVIVLLVAAPVIAKGALKIQVWEYFWLGIVGISISANLTTNKLYKGIIAGMIGLLITVIGIDTVHGGVRLIFGLDELKGGVSLVPALIGLFGFTEALDTIAGNKPTLVDANKKRTESLLSLSRRSLVMILREWVLTLRSSLIGIFIGALPGVGPDVASWVSYDDAKRTSKNKNEFGKGAWQGIMASETANNAATSGVFIPLMTLGIPGDAVTAVIMGGLILHGLHPGPTFYVEQAHYVNWIISILILTNLFLIINGLAITRFLTPLATIPSGVIMPIVTVCCVIGTYAVNYRLFDVYIMIFFGVLGFIMRRIDLPAPPMVLGVILGPMIEENLRRAIIIDSNLLLFFTRPISIGIIIFSIIIIFGPAIRNKFFAKKVPHQQSIN